jgi:arsenite-transporting ATPase
LQEARARNQTKGRLRYHWHAVRKHFIRSQGGDIARYNLASEPQAFADNDAAKSFLHLSGSAGLPLVLVDGVTAMTGRYPDRTQLATWAGLDVPNGAGLGITEASASADGCCGGASSCC